MKHKFVGTMPSNQFMDKDAVEDIFPRGVIVIAHYQFRNVVFLSFVGSKHTKYIWVITSIASDEVRGYGTAKGLYGGQQLLDQAI